MLITRKSVISGVERTFDIPVNPDDLMLFMNTDTSIEDAMPYLNDKDKQFILSGITEKEWNEAFKQMEVI